MGKVASVDDTPSVHFGRTTFRNCGSHPTRADDSRHCVPAEGPRGLCLEPTSNGSTEYCALRTTTMRKGFYLMPQVKCGTSETCNGVAMATAAFSSSNNWGHMGLFWTTNSSIRVPFATCVTEQYSHSARSTMNFGRVHSLCSRLPQKRIGNLLRCRNECGLDCSKRPRGSERWVAERGYLRNSPAMDCVEKH